MDVFKIDQSLNGNLGNAPAPDKIIVPDVTFDAGSEFNLSFFDQPSQGHTEDSNTAQGFSSDPGSVGSASASSPPPRLHTPIHQTPTQSLQFNQHLHLTTASPGSSTPSSSVVSSPGSTSCGGVASSSSITSQIVIKQGNK